MYYDELLKLDTQYYANNEGFIEEHKKYTEELFNLKRQLRQEDFKNQEHEIFLLSKQSATQYEQINIYKKLLDQIKQLEEEAINSGLAGNLEYIQELQKQWHTYFDNIAALYNEIYELEKTASAL